MSVDQENIFDARDFRENLHPDLWDLSKDLRDIFNRGIQADFVLRVTENTVKIFNCHRDILRTRSKWFSQKITEAGASNANIMIEVQEKHDIISAVLKYIYTADLKLLESLSIPLTVLQNAAKKYGLTSLENIVTDVIKSDTVLEKSKSIQFMWNLAVDQNNFILAVCPALQDFTLHGSDKWGLEIQPLIQDDDSRISEFYLTREVTNEAHNITHTINITVKFMNPDSSPLCFSREISVSEDGKYKIFVFTVNSDNTEYSSDTPVTLSCELTVSAKGGDIENFHLKGIHRRHINSELITLSEDMYQVLKDSEYTDISIKSSVSSTVYRLHSYIILGRSKMPVPYIAKLGYVADFDCESWRSFIYFLYTGQSRYLDGHMRLVYNFFIRWKLAEPAQKYEKILANHLNLSNAFGILCDAINNGSRNLMVCAARYLAFKSSVLREPRAWISIASSNTGREIFQIRY